MNPATDRNPVKFLLLAGLCLVWTIILCWLMAIEEWKAVLAIGGLGPLLILLFYLRFKPEFFLYAIVFFIPLSVRGDLPGGFSVSLPAEAMVVLIVFYWILYPGQFRPPDRRIFSHPLFLILVVQIGWLLVTSFLSSDQVVSIKRTIIQVLYLIVFFYLFFTRFTTPAAILRFYAFYALGLVVPIINGFIWHSQYHFSQPSSYYMPQPFYIEHTIYGAAIAFVIPALFYIAFVYRGSARQTRIRPAFAFLFLLCMVAVFLAYSRAAWMSLLSVPVLLVIFRYRIRIPYLLAAAVAAGIILFMNTGTIMDYLRQNEASSNRNDLQEQIASVSNIQSDISNLERINRWKCAIRMFQDRPVTGYGPGTYQFEYGRFQVKLEMTRISTYHGEKGNAHSEYLGALAETGFPGLLIYLSVMLAALFYAFRIIYRSKDPLLRGLTIMVALCLVPFYLHTVFNAFLENDEIGSLYYGSLAAIAALDLFFYRKTENTPA